jgi:hypothetical protein
MSITIAAGPKKVEPSAIERELETLWISMPSAGGPASTTTAMRAIVANLIIARDSEPAMAGAMEVAGNIIANNPCRMIQVTSDPDLDPPALIAEVAVICQKSKTCQRCVCCDQIRLAACGIMADNLPSMTAGLLVPDLPVIIWWPKPPFARKDFGRFAEQANRVIVDTAAYDQNDLRELAGFVEQSRQTGTAVSDLNWARLTTYRQIFAQFFDSLECRDYLAAIHSIRIEAAASTGLLLAGWLKAQMDKYGYLLPRDRITPAPNGSDVFSFQSLAMTCSGGKNSFTVIRKDERTLEARSNLDSKVLTRVIKAVLPPEDKLLGDELTFSGRDTVFETSLAAAAAL